MEMFRFVEANPYIVFRVIGIVVLAIIFTIIMNLIMNAIKDFIVRWFKVKFSKEWNGDDRRKPGSSNYVTVDPVIMDRFMSAYEKGAEANQALASGQRETANHLGQITVILKNQSNAIIGLTDELRTYTLTK